MFKLFVNYLDPLKFQYLIDKYNDKPITLFIDKPPSSHEELRINTINILVLNEPNEFFGLHTWAKTNHYLFDIILTWNQELLESLPNAVRFCGNSMPDFKDLKYINSFKEKNKNFESTFLCGTKLISQGHKLRNDVFKIKDNITTPKKWFYVLDDFDKDKNVRPGYTEYSKDLSHIPEGEYPEHYGKRILFEDSMFHVCIENTQHLNFYTEKISQAFSTKTVPIYWGCPNLNELGYDERGIIKFTNTEELINIVNNLTPELYHDMKPFIDYNYEVSIIDTVKNQYLNFFDQFITTNNL
jgi:hypothetical protein